MRRTVMSLWAWSSIAAMASTGCVVQAALMPTWLVDRSRRLGGRAFRVFTVASTRLNPMWDFGIHGPVPRELPARTVVVSNHVSNGDAFLIAQLPWPMKWLGKRELFSVPILGWFMWLGGCVPVERGNRDSTKRAMARCATWIRRGAPVIIFPEGTRSKTAELLPFKDGAFRLAIETQAHILPLAVAGTEAALPKHEWRFGDAVARVIVGEPIATDGLSLDDLEELKAQTRAAIEALRAEIIPLTTSAEHLIEAAALLAPST